MLCLAEPKRAKTRRNHHHPEHTHIDLINRERSYSMLTFLDCGAVAFGTTMLKIPFFRLALTAS